MSIYYNENMVLVSDLKRDKIFAKHYKLKEMNSNNYSEKEYLLYQIISSAELILDDLYDGTKLTDRNLDQIKLADQILLDIQQELDNVNKPSQLK